MVAMEELRFSGRSQSRSGLSARSIRCCLIFFFFSTKVPLRQRFHFIFSFPSPRRFSASTRVWPVLGTPEKSGTKMAATQKQREFFCLTK